MTLKEFFQWDKLTLYGARPRNQVKVNELFVMMCDEDGSINRCDIRSLFTESPP